MNWTMADAPRQTGRTFVITGAGGLGFETALALAKQDANIILAGRNEEKGRVAVSNIQKSAPGAKVFFRELDLANLASVHRFAEGILAELQSVDVLINNAGVAAVTRRGTTADSFELQIGTNHLGHFALTMLLWPLLARATAPRVVTLSSSTHKMGRIDFDDLQAERSYNPQRAYAQSKLATLMFALELDERVKKAGIPLVSVAAHPGIAQTELMSNGPAGRPVMQFFAHLVERLLGQSAADGALPTLRAATDPSVRGGEYYGPSGFLEAKGPPVLVSPSERASDPIARRRLWEVSASLTGLDLPADPKHAPV